MKHFLQVKNGLFTSNRVICFLKLIDRNPDTGNSQHQEEVYFLVPKWGKGNTNPSDKSGIIRGKKGKISIDEVYFHQLHLEG